MVLPGLGLLPERAALLAPLGPLWADAHVRWAGLLRARRRSGGVRAPRPRRAFAEAPVATVTLERDASVKAPVRRADELDQRGTSPVRCAGSWGATKGFHQC